MFHNGAKSVLSVLNYLFLPTLLGLLGSLAHVIRGILDSFSRSSITLASRRRWETRVLLGGLLGLITGAVLAPDLGKIGDLSFSPLVWPFLVGYSVEFAFSVFDTVIERGRRTLETAKEQAVREGDPGIRVAAEKPAS